MRLHAKISSQFDDNGLIEFDVLPGAVYTETYNEELDSGSIIIAHQTRRMTNIAPYDWVRIYDEGGTFARTMLVDDFAETRPNIFEPIYDYTINLMSETKLLEKIQLPNRQWQHSLTGERKTLRQAIAELCESYIPKVKTASGGSWRYEYAIDFGDFADPESEAYSKFGVPTADISLSQPTLRQAISAFMAQIGCIPAVRDGKLGWLDLRAEPRPLAIAGDSFAQTQRSNSSDSYVSELVSQGENILDSENSTVSETLGFRDRGKVFLKQTENLYLETRYPIYKVTKLAMNFFAVFSKLVQPLVESCAKRDAYVTITQDASFWTVMFQTDSVEPYTAKNIRAIFMDQSLAMPNVFTYKKIREEHPADITFSSTSEILEKTIYFPWDYGDSLCVVYDLYKGNQYQGTGYRRFHGVREALPGEYYEGNILGRLSYDISSLCLENRRRSLLETDFTKMNESSITSLEDLSRYAYGTVGYDIGDNRIAGWSSTYSYIFNDSWWAIYSQNITKTYIENIIDHLKKYPSSIETESIRKTISQWLFGSLEYIYLLDLENEYPSYILNSSGQGRFDILNPYDNQTNNFTSVFFDVEYQPLNRLSVRYTKEGKDVPIPFQQLDSPKDAISSMDALAANETDLVNRLGNAATSMSQYANDSHWDDIGWFNGTPLKTDDGIVFQITYSFDLNGTAVNYFMSESAIIRNYFTSIQTKYRAYQYVGYDQAVVRKENVKVYALLSKKNMPNMDEKIRFGSFDSQGSYSDLLSPFDNEESYDERKITMSYESCIDEENEEKTYKNECSIVTYRSNVILNQESFDNVSSGISQVIDSEYDEVGGGVPQKWYLWPDSYHVSHSVGWSNLKIADFYHSDDWEKVSEAIVNLPDLSFFTKMPYESGPSVIVSLVDDLNSTTKTYYKDYSEIVNQSLQIEYYSDDPNIEFGEWFADSICWKSGNSTDGWEKAIKADDGTRWEMSSCIEVDPTDISVRIINVPYGQTDIAVGLMKGDAFRPTITFHDARIGDKYYLRLNDTKTTKAYLTDPDTGLKYLGYLIQPSAGL